MIAAEILRALLHATLASSAAIALALLVRVPLRRMGGAGIAYAVWWIVPVALLAGLLPAASQAPAIAPVRAFVVEVSPRVLVDDTAGVIDWMPAVLAAWWLGIAIRLATFVRQQRRFQRTLGELQPRDDGMHQARALQGLPAAIGLWSPRIVVPEDFDRRYDLHERALLQAHERAHIAHGDLAVNAFVALLRCVFWFNPLLHGAAHAFRQDQELACDQRVITRHPQARRRYGEAMLKTQLASQPLPLGCHWGFSHPLKERIAMLNKPLPTTRRLLAGTACVLALALASGYAAWAAQPADTAQSVPAGKLRVDTTLRIDDAAPVTATQLAAPGTPFLLRQTANGHAWEVSAQVAPAKDGLHLFAAVITRDGEQVSAPKIAMKAGEPGRIQIGEDATATGGGFKGIQLDVTVTGATAPATGAMSEPEHVSAAPMRTQAPGDEGIADLPAPSYPREALAQNIDGTVVLDIDIDARGKVTAVSVAKSDPAGVFDAAAMEAAWKWQFAPAMENGKPVAGRVQVPVRFEHERGQGPGGDAQA